MKCNLDKFHIIYAQTHNPNFPICPRLPYNWKTPTAYLFTMVIQFAATFYLGAIIVCFILFGGLCEFLVAFKHDLTQRILHLEKRIFICSFKGYGCTTSNNINRKVCLHEIFQFHSQALQYVTELEITI